MKYFEHEWASTFEEAASELKGAKKGSKVVIAGGRLVALNVEGAPCHEIGAAFRRADAKGLVGEFVRSMCSIETPVCKEEKRVV